MSEFERNGFDTDVFLPLEMSSDLGALFNKTVDFICENQLFDTSLWKRFVDQFRSSPDDGNYGWRCEYWGKMMRGAAFVYDYTKDEKLYFILRSSVEDLLSAEDVDGRISTYSKAEEFHGWDMWGRKYVLLGLQYFYEICHEDDLREHIISSMCRQTDYIISKVGDGKLSICDTAMTKSGSLNWLGINSMSVLEPFVRLYNITNQERYLDFASYIVNMGIESKACIFHLALDDKLYPYEYPTTKAYEMMSCFEGLCEYYRVRKEEKYRRAVLNFGRRVLMSEISVIGSCGCTHELFDHTAFSQTDDSRIGIMQETCVSVTLMKLCYQLLRLSGDPAYADTVERCFFNAYLGALNTHKIESSAPEKKGYPEGHRTLTFDSYSPLRPGVRGAKIGGLMRFDDGDFYGCCVCISPAGVGLIPKIMLLRAIDGVALNFYMPGSIRFEYCGANLKLDISGGYPYGDGRVRMVLHTDTPTKFKLYLRIPSWSRETELNVCGKCFNATSGTYFAVEREWQDNDTIELGLDMSVQIILPEAGAPGENKYIALRRGPVMLAADARLGISPELPIKVCSDNQGRIPYRIVDDSPVNDSYICVAVKTEDGDRLVIDYSSAGKTYDSSSLMAVWLVK